jgi:hypothetical protein
LTLFARAANELFPGSSLALAQALARNQRTVQRWIAGAMWPPADVWQAVAGLLRARGRKCAQLEREITDREQE